MEGRVTDFKSLLRSLVRCAVLSIVLIAPALGQTDTNQTYTGTNQTDARQIDAAYWFDKGMTFYILNNYSESIKAYDRALEIDSEDAQTWNNKGIDLGILGRYDEALSAFDKATDINSSYAEAWYNMGVIYDLQGRYNSAIDAYNRATQINPEYQKALENKNVDIDIVMGPTLSCGCSRQLPVL